MYTGAPPLLLAPPAPGVYATVDSSALEDTALDSKAVSAPAPAEERGLTRRLTQQVWHFWSSLKQHVVLQHGEACGVCARI